MSVLNEMKILIIIPAYNEEESLPGVIGDLRAHVPSVELLVVNDGSRDGTARIARSLGVPVLDLPFNLGIGGAVQAGYLYAMQNGYDVAVQFDGDGQHVAAEIKKLLEPLGSGEGGPRDRLPLSVPERLPDTRVQEVRHRYFLVRPFAYPRHAGDGQHLRLSRGEPQGDRIFRPDLSRRLSGSGVARAPAQDAHADGGGRRQPCAAAPEESLPLRPCGRSIIWRKCLWRFSSI